MAPSLQKQDPDRLKVDAVKYAQAGVFEATQSAWWDEFLEKLTTTYANIPEDPPSWLPSCIPVVKERCTISEPVPVVPQKIADKATAEKTKTKVC